MKPLAGETGSSGPGGGSGRPYSAATFASIAESTRSASASRPCLASQRGLSGRPRRRNTTTGAASAPISTTQRQPSIPNGAAGTSSKARNEMIGTQVKPIA